MQKPLKPNPKPSKGKPTWVKQNHTPATKINSGNQRWLQWKIVGAVLLSWKREKYQ